MNEQEFAQEVLKKNLLPGGKYEKVDGKHYIRVSFGAGGKNTDFYIQIVSTNSGYKLNDDDIKYVNIGDDEINKRNGSSLKLYLKESVVPAINKSGNSSSSSSENKQPLSLSTSKPATLPSVLTPVPALPILPTLPNLTPKSNKLLVVPIQQSRQTVLKNNTAQTSLLLKKPVLKAINKQLTHKQPWNWTWDGDDDVEIGNLKFTGLKGLQLNDSQAEQLKAALGGLGYDTNNLSGSLKQYLQNKKNSLSYSASLTSNESKPINDYYDDRLRGGLQNLYSFISGGNNRGATWRLGKNDYNDIINSDWYNLLDDNSKEYFTRDKLNNQLGDRYFRSYLIGMNNNGKL